MDVSQQTRTLNTPNVLTVIRLFLAIALPFLWFADSLQLRLLGGSVFAIGGLTDYLDGQLARRNKQVTTFGKIVDPIADKMLTLGAFLTLSILGMFPLWLIVPIIFRELLITVLRFYFLYYGTAVAAVMSGKQKFTLQLGAIFFGFIKLLFVNHSSQDLQARTAESLGLAINVILYAFLLVALENFA